MNCDDATILKVLSEYNSCGQGGSSVEDEFRLAVVDCDVTNREGLFNFPPSDTKNAWTGSIDEEACASDYIRCKMADSLPVEEPAHPQEHELRALMTASLEGDGAAYHALLNRLTGHLRAYYRHRFA